MIEARSEALRWIRLAVKPVVSVGTMNPLIPSSVRAQTMAMSATLPLVIHILVPLMIQSEPSLRALVLIDEGSDPESGSVSPKQPMMSPAAIPGQPGLFLLLRPELPDREHRQRPLDRNERAGAGVARLEFDAGQAVGGGAGSGAAVALEVHAEKPESSHLLGEFLGEGAFLPPRAHLGQDLLFGEPTNGVAQQLLLVAEERVDVEKVARIRGGHAGRLTPDGGRW